MKKKCYLSSAIAGLKYEDVVANFQRLRAIAEGDGFDAISPLDVPPADHDGPCPVGRRAVSHAGHTDACNLRADIIAMLQCDAVLFDSNWQSSWGARSELTVAGVAGLRIMFVHGRTGRVSV